MQPKQQSQDSNFSAEYFPLQLLDGEDVGLLAIDRGAVEARLGNNLVALGVPRSLASEHAGVLLNALRKHVQRWLSAELVEWPLHMALLADESVDWKDPDLLLKHWSGHPDVLMEVLSLPVVRGTVGYVRKRGTKKQRKRLKVLLGRAASGKPGRPRAKVQGGNDASLALEVKVAERRLEAGFGYARKVRRTAGYSTQGDLVPEDKISLVKELSAMDYDRDEVEAIVRSAIPSTGKLSGAANRTVAARRHMREATVRARASKGRKLLRGG